jgi:hypothetical protein
MAQFSQEFFPKERVIMPTAQGYQAGVIVNKFMTHGGEVDFNPDIFLSKTRALQNNASSFKAPAVGTLTYSAATDLTGTDGDWAKQGAGTYMFKATFNNSFGESVPTDAVTVTLGSGDLAKHVKLTITNPASTSFPVEYIRLYRTEKDGSKYYEVAKFGVTNQNSEGVTTFEDKGVTIANTYTAFMGEMSPDILGFKQLAPMMKMDLATLGPVIRWMILMYGVPVLYAPRKWLRFTNIKADVPGTVQLT